MNVATIPIGTYSIAAPNVRGYITPTATSTNITGTPLTNTLTLNYIAYSNDLAITVSGLLSYSEKIIWSVTGPTEFTNSVNYATSRTNNYTITAVPTGSYTFTFPAVVGYTAPATITTNITGAPLINNITGVYVSVIWDTTNIPPGPPTNFPAITNDITLMVDTNGLFKTPSREKIITANGLLTNGAVGPPGPAGTNGADGAVGPQGPAGSNGANGAAGSQGPAGTNGAAGPQGPAGTNGSDGATGPAGTNGATGAMGPAGPVTNQVITYLGIKYTITNDPAATGDILKFDPATSNAWFAAETWKGGELNGKAGAYFYNSKNGTNYWITFP